MSQSEVLMDAKDAIECALHYLRTGDGPPRYIAERLRTALENLEEHEWPEERIRQ